MHLSLPVKFAIVSFVITLFGVVGVAMMAYHESDILLQQEAVRGLSIQMEKEISTLEKQAELIRKDVAFLARSKEIRALAEHLSDQADARIDVALKQLQYLFATVLNQRDMYYQVRLIGIADQGRELVRVARLQRGIAVVEKERLQQKGKRSYFLDSIKLEAGEFLFSDITLNREHGKITQPPQPMLRVSTALFDGAGKRYAVLLINVDFNVLTESLQNQHSQQRFFMINHQGDYLVHPDAKRAMAFEYQRQFTFQDDYLLTDKTLQQSYEHAGTRIEEHLFEQHEKALLIGQIHFDHHMDRYLRVAATVELHQLREQSIGLRDRMLWLTFALALALGLITFLFAKYLTRPVEGMIDAAVAISEGDEQVHIPAGGKDEIGRLGIALRQMLDHLKSARLKTETLNVALEAKVSQRTAQLARLAGELEAQNAQLEKAVLDAEQAGMAKSQFLATMSHEIRTPLNGVLGLTELVLATELDPQQRENLQIVQSSGETLLTILNDILDFSKIEAGLMEMKAVEFNPNEVIEHVAKLFSGKVNADEARLEMIARGLPQLPNLLIGDSDRLHQVMMNLLSNAVKFTERGEIVISVDLLSESDGEACVRFQLADSGPGISQENQQELFNEFTQADGTDTRKHGGTGLGLSIVKRLVALMGGEIQLESGMGKGSRFFFDLSLQKGAAITDGPHNYRDHFAAWRILVVDDNASNREMLHNMLTAWGMLSESCSCGSSALKALRQRAATDEPYGMVLIDQQMHGMDGMALARVIKETPELQSLKVIMATSLDMSFDAHTRDQYGLDGFIRKPVYVHSLFETVLSVMGVRERQITQEQVSNKVQRHERILLAEDNSVNQQVAVGMLGNQGFMHVDVAHHGVEALELFGEYSYDLILMDVQMPELDGISTTREIREIEQYNEDGKHIPIIALTAHAMPEDMQRTREAGMDAHLSKPLTGKALQSALAQWLPLTDGDQLIGLENTEAEAEADQWTADAIQTSVLDEAALRQLRADMGFGIGMILDTFVAELPKQVDAIAAAIAAGDGDALRRNGHRLKGASRSISAGQLGELAYQLEKLGEQGDMAAADALFDAFKQMAEQVQQALNESWLEEIR